MPADTVLLYSWTLREEELRSAVAPHVPLVVASEHALAQQLVGGRDIAAVVVQEDEIDGALMQLLKSLRIHFPMIPLIIVTNEHLPDALDEKSIRIPGGLPREELLEQLSRKLTGASSRDRRRYCRYDWPLTAEITGYEGRYRIRSLSAGGAFLEHRDPMPEPGTEIELIVHFHGSSFVSHCRVLERRMASSNLPPGQGLAFTALSEYARRILDQLVGDALVRALTEPDPEPSVPTIGEEEFELSLAPEFDPN